MKKNISIFVILFSVFTLYAQTIMPEKMAKSIIMIRPGIMDMGNTTVEQLFLNKIFENKEQLDGTFATSKYGATRLEGNTYYLDIDMILGEKILGTFTFVLEFQGETTLLQKIVVVDNQKNLTEESSAFSDKFQVLKMFSSWQKKE